MSDTQIAVEAREQSIQEMVNVLSNETANIGFEFATNPEFALNDTLSQFIESNIDTYLRVTVNDTHIESFSRDASNSIYQPLPKTNLEHRNSWHEHKTYTVFYIRVTL